MNRKSIGPWIVLLAFGLSGCGVELVGGEETGTSEAVMTDDAGTEQAAADRTDGMSMSRSASGSAQIVDIEGSVSADVSVALMTPGGSERPITTGDVTGSVRIGSVDRFLLGRRKVETGRHPSVRVTFTRVQAQLETAVLGPGGLALPLAIEVDLSGQPLVVEVPLEVVIREDETTTVEIDLNAAAWLILADPSTGLVPRAAFASAVEVTR